MKKLIAALAASIALSSQANTVTTDFTDLWFNANESGWGVNIIQQQDVIFATLFVYGQNNAPTWYVGSDIRYQGSQGADQVFTGTLFQTSGPFFGGPFNPSAVTNRSVGTFTFRASRSDAATITYSVDGTNVTKSITRQTWRNQNFAGSYRGAVVGTYSGCTQGNGPYESPAILTITQNGGSIQIHEAGNGYTCTYTGNYTPAGNSGVASGSGSCSDGFAQTWSASEMKVGLDFFSAAFTSRIGASCNFVGRLGGIRRN